MLMFVCRYSKREDEHDMSEYTHLITDKPKVEGFTPVIQIMGTDLKSLLRYVMTDNSLLRLRGCDQQVEAAHFLSFGHEAVSIGSNNFFFGALTIRVSSLMTCNHQNKEVALAP
jgi:hypothetical protein